MQNSEKKSFHFIAIGGVGMSGLAKYLLEKGEIVTGSDVQESKYTKNLEKMGAKVFIGHDESNISGAQTVIASTAIQNNNVEIMKAQKLNLPILHRSDLLQSIANEFSSNENSIFIGFSGTHGKTTTSGLCAYLLNKAGLKPSYIVGGIIPELNDNAKYDDEKFFSAELDESDGTILKYQPDISVINNLEVDHVDFYKDGFEDLLKTFSTYLSNLSESAKVIINKDCDGNKKLMGKNSTIKFITFGLNDADYVAKDIIYKDFGSEFNIFKNGEKIAAIKLSVPGKHNIYNALAVFVSLYESGVETNSFVQHFQTFTGMGRRFQLSATFNDIKVIDDYAHHPSEIKTTVESTKNNTNARVVAIFQPHRFSRLKGLWDDFLNSFDDADKLIVLDVFAASEKAIAEANSEVFANKIKHNDATYISGSIQESAKKILPLLKPSDIVLTLGAGDITKMGSFLKEEFHKRG